MPKRSASAPVPEVLAGSVLPDLGSGVSPSQSKPREGGEVSRHGNVMPRCDCGERLELCSCGELRCFYCSPVAVEPWCDYVDAGEGVMPVRGVTWS